MIKQLRIANPRLRKSKYLEALQEDLRLLSDAAASNKFSGIQFPDPAILCDLLAKVTRDFGVQNEHCRLARLMVSILHDYVDDLPYGKAADRIKLRAGLNALSRTIGSIPSFDREPTLPSDAFLTKNFADNRLEWQAHPCDDPKRGKSKFQVHFLVKGGRSSVRSHLKDHAESDEIRILEVNGKVFFLNLLDFDYYPEALLHADHMHSSAMLMNRQKELIAAMNYNPRYREHMMSTFGGSGYFIERPDHSIVGSYWFYMSFHNSIENLWYLLASENSGSKGGGDPVEWLNTSRLGQKFLAYLDATKQQINRSDLFYRLSSGDSLKDAFVTWAEREHRELYKTTKFIVEQHKIDMRVIIAGGGSSKALKHYRVAEKAKVRAKRKAVGGVDDDVASVDTDDTDGFAGDMADKLLANARYFQLADEMAELEDEAFEKTKDQRAAKRRRSEKAGGSASEDGDLSQSAGGGFRK